MSEPRQNSTWIGAIREAASEQHFDLPPFTSRGMGSVVWRDPDWQRSVSLKRPLVPAEQAAKAGTEWTLWIDDDGHSVPVATLREAAMPTPERVAFVLSVLKGWFMDEWTVAHANHALEGQPDTRFPEIHPPKGQREEYWLSEDRAFGIVVENDRWGIYSRETALSEWKAKDQNIFINSLPLAELDRFCEWLVESWFFIAFGSDSRPA